MGATYDGAPFCFAPNYLDNGGIWYSFTPNTDLIATVSTCDAATFNTIISVYSGGCDNLTCVAGQDNNFTECSNFTTKLDFCASAGVEYLIEVHGRTFSYGDFTLSLTCDASSSNDNVCQSKTILLGTPSLL